ncbi:transcriptional regulator [Pseudooceanicola nanhaiensis]|jgi:CRP-like cAMP-binding protein|uniref:Transcriptional regulator n=1 Tax=Pseudooceanicola nanhaiensis TaxID=375761 RepID=A0A917SUU8_9RHOB|nr:Crp/Fnr family transcriptional regulator [Pseudooceanicola nanhaiensis]GGL97315.1 transcriptional regulator [Pseudooceanicola nanhaiensis]
MSREAYPLSHRFLRGRGRSQLSADDCGTIENLFHDVERFTTAHTILERGDVLDQSTLLIEGFVARVIREEGKRHIVALHVPGDFVDLHAFALKRLDHDVVSIGPVQIGYVKHARLEALIPKKPQLMRMLWFSTLLDAAIHREWILKLEQLSADGRLAHLIAETWQRLDFVGLAQPTGFAFPLTQAELADACGTTPIHLNRVVRKLRETGVADISRGRVSVLDHAALKDIGRFNTAYLYGQGPLHLD